MVASEDGKDQNLHHISKAVFNLEHRVNFVAVFNQHRLTLDLLTLELESVCSLHLLKEINDAILGFGCDEVAYLLDEVSLIRLTTILLVSREHFDVD